MLEGEDLCDPQEMDRRQGRLPQVIGCSVGYETRGLNLEEQRERRRSVGSLPVFLACVACGFAGVPSVVGASETVKVEGGNLAEEGCHRRYGQQGRKATADALLQL